MLKVVDLPNQSHPGVDVLCQKCLEKGKHVRIASRMLGAKLIELYFRLIDRGMFLGVPGGIFFRGEMAD